MISFRFDENSNLLISWDVLVDTPKGCRAAIVLKKNDINLLKALLKQQEDYAPSLSTANN